MLHSTKGIVIHTIKYSETSVIAKIYTELFGIQSYLLKGIRSTKSKIRPGLFQPMTLLDLVVYHKETQSLHAVKEVRLAHAFLTLPFDIRKSSVALYINELIYKTVREEESNAALFAFLWNCCLQLDEMTEGVSGFPLIFTIRLMHYLGIFPRNNQSALLPVFNLREGQFQASIPDHSQYLDTKQSKILSELLEASSIQHPASSIPHPASRNNLLDILLTYYQLHLPGFGGVQSHHILHDVLS